MGRVRWSAELSHTIYHKMNMVDTEIALSTSPIQDIRSFRPAETTMLGCLLDVMICSFRWSKPHIATISKPEYRPTNSREDDKGWPTSRRGFDEYCPYLGRFWMTGGSLSTSGFQKYSGRAGGARFCRTPVDFGPLAGRVACGFGLRVGRRGGTGGRFITGETGETGETGIMHGIRHGQAETNRDYQRQASGTASGTHGQRQTGIQAVRHGQADTETGIQAFRHSRPPAACSPASAAELLHVEAGPAIRVRVPSLCLPCPALCQTHLP